MTVVLSQYRPSIDMEMVVYGRDVDSYFNWPVTRFSFLPAKKSIERVALTGSHGDFPMRNFRSIRLDNLRIRVNGQRKQQIPDGREAEIQSLEFRNGYYTLRLLSGPLHVAMENMRECMNNLVRHWGYDPVTQGSLSKEPTPLTEPNTWLTEADYPVVPLILRQRAIVHFRLDIDRNGVPTRCAVISATKPQTFEEMSCKLLLERARFSPAMDKNGQPVESFYANSVLWTFP